VKISCIIVLFTKCAKLAVYLSKTSHAFRHSSSVQTTKFS